MVKLRKTINYKCNYSNYYGVLPKDKPQNEEFLGGEKGLKNQVLKRFFADRMNNRFQRQLILRKLLSGSGSESFLNPGVVNAQKLVLSSGHVDEISLALCPFLVQELVHRLVSRSPMR